MCDQSGVSIVCGSGGLSCLLVTDLHASPAHFRLRCRGGARHSREPISFAHGTGKTRSDNLDRGELRSTTDTHRDGEAETDARLTSLIPRLTSPSRNDAQLVDIWFAIERRHRSHEWDDAFARVADGWRPDPRHLSHFALFSHPCSSALIV